MSDPVTGFQKVSKKQVKELLQEEGWTKDEAFSRRSASGSVYRHTDGRVLEAIVPGPGLLYAGIDQFILELARVEKLKSMGAQHILKGRLPYAQDFPQHVPELIDQLAVRFKIPREELNGSVDSLTKVDEKIKRYGKRKTFESDLFAMILAYAGEVLRLRIKGQWLMRLDENDNETWEPFIVGSNGNYYAFFSHIYEQFEERAGVSTRSAIEMEIRFGGRSPDIYERKPDSHFGYGSIVMKKRPEGWPEQ
jgi:hypothetical protein